jgi:lysophospholipase L1-like esterase
LLRFVATRSDLHNARLRFERAKEGHVAFIGGSITEMDGYRPLIMKHLEQRFPQTRFTFTQAGIASTCSTTGAMRLRADVLTKGPTDLLFAEFAVNDDQDAFHTRQDAIRGMEGIARQLRAHNPHADMVVTHFVNESMRDALIAGKTPLTIEAHEAVAAHYGLTSSNLAREVATRIAGGQLTWKEYGGTHPGKPGNRLAADMVIAALDHAWAPPLAADAAPTPHATPAPLEPGNYDRGRFLPLTDAKLGDGWRIETPDWKKLKGQSRSRFTSIPVLVGDRPGATLTLSFTGRAVGIYLLAGPDAASVEASVDGQGAKKIDTFHRYSANLHYPRTLMLADDLTDGPHTLTLRLVEGERGGAPACRIMHFVAN